MDYKQKIKEIGVIINNIDPAGLLEGGAPYDEYDSFILSVFSILEKDTWSLEEKVISLMKNTFGEENLQNTERYSELFRLLLEVKQKSKKF